MDKKIVASITEEFYETGSCVMDGFLTEKEISLLIIDVNAITEKGLFKPASISSGIDTNVNTKTRSDYIDWLEEGDNPFTAIYLYKIKQLIVCLNQRCFLGINNSEFHYSKYPIGSFYNKHVDVFKNNTARKISIIVASICIVAAIVAGFVVLGSPRTQRLVKYDQTKISDLQNIASQVRYFYDTNKVLPQTLTEIAQGNAYGVGTYTDVQTSKPYVYKIINATTFEVCAVFNKDFKYNSGITSINEPVTKSDEQGVVEVWGAYKAGESCFRQIVGPSTVPPSVPAKI
jgi:hypothetical protein